MKYQIEELRKLPRKDLFLELKQFKKKNQKRFSLVKVLRYLIYFLTLVYQIMETAKDVIDNENN